MVDRRAVAMIAELDAWERYEEASAKAARFLQGGQYDLFDTSRDEARFWFDTSQACAGEALRNG